MDCLFTWRLTFLPIVVGSRRPDHLGGSPTPLPLREARTGTFDACPPGDHLEFEAVPHDGCNASSFQ
jgi:hypothetical protein